MTYYDYFADLSMTCGGLCVGMWDGVRYTLLPLADILAHAKWLALFG